MSLDVESSSNLLHCAVMCADRRSEATAKRKLGMTLDDDGDDDERSEDESDDDRDDHVTPHGGKRRRQAGDDDEPAAVAVDDRSVHWHVTHVFPGLEALVTRDRMLLICLALLLRCVAQSCLARACASDLPRLGALCVLLPCTANWLARRPGYNKSLSLLK